MKGARRHLLLVEKGSVIVQVKENDKKHIDLENEEEVLERTEKMNNDLKKKGSFVGLVPLLIFLAIYFAMGIGTGSFDNLPLMVGILIASGIALVMRKPNGEKMSFDEKVTIFCKGGGDHTLILMVVIFILAGAFYGVANGMHAVDTVTNLGLAILPAKMILPGLFVIGCILSFAMGTSMGTVLH